ncbi:MAG: DUF819 family protein [Paludibacteraceae bacterium]|nr:DUF819 family protein [Paludibacteraceae bacterium]
MIKAYIILACYILFPLLIIEGFKRYVAIQKIGTVVLAYAVGIIASLCGVFHFSDPTVAATFSKLQSTLMSVAVPLAIPLMLFNCDFKLWTKALPKTAWALVAGIGAVVVSVISGYFIFRNYVPEAAKVSGMMTGIYTGGTMNFNALGASLGVDKSVMAIVLAFQMVITTPYIFFLLGGGYKIFRKLLPYKDVTHRGRTDDGSVETADVENYRGMLEKNNLLGMIKGLGLSIAFLAVGAGLAVLTTGTLNELVVILTITTLSIIASFFKKVRELPKTFELGMFFILVFSVIVASMFDINSVNGGSLYIGGFVLWIMGVSVILHLILCRIAKVSGDLFCVCQVGLLCSPPFVPPIAGAMKNKKVLISGIVVGLVGYAIGTYTGALLALVLGGF